MRAEVECAGGKAESLHDLVQDVWGCWSLTLSQRDRQNKGLETNCFWHVPYGAQPVSGGEDAIYFASTTMDITNHMSWTRGERIELQDRARKDGIL